MNHVKALLIKFIMCTAVLWIVLGVLYNVTFGDILTIGLLLTGVSYIVGDLLILPKLGNQSATIADFVLAFFGTWVLGAMLIEHPIPLVTASFISALLITIGEYFFHRYMDNHVLDEDQDDRSYNRHQDLQTEYSQELDPNERKQK